MKSTLTAVMTIVLLCFMAVASTGCQQDSGITGVDQTSVSQQASGELPNVQTGLIGSLVGLLDKLLGQVVQLVLPGQGALLHVRTTSFEIPAGALSTQKIISYSLWDAMPPAGLANAAPRLFKFGPEGTTFNTQCTMVVPFSELNLGNTDPRTIKCYYYNETTRHYEEQPTVVDIRNQKFTVKISHFSQYAFGRLQ